MLRRIAPRRSAPYPAVGNPVHVPLELWSMSVSELRSYAAARAEAIVFWGGVVCGEHVQVTGLYVLRHSAQGGTVRLTRGETRWLLRELRQRDEKLLAQFHSHPREAYHSDGDDQHAAAFHDGFLSIVAPDHAVNVRLPSDCAVHEYRDGRFLQLSPPEIDARLNLRSWVARRCPTPGWLYA